MDTVPPSHACQRVEDALRAWRTEAEEAKGRVAEQLKAARTQLDGLAESLRVQAQGAERLSGEALTRLAELTESLENGAEGLEGAKRRIAELEQDIAEHADAESAARLRIETLEQELARREGELEALRERSTQGEEMATALAAAQTKLDEFATGATTHSQELAAVRDTAAAAAAERDAAQGKLAETEKSLADLRRQAAESGEALDTARMRLAELEEANERLEAEFGAMKAQIADMPTIDPEAVAQLETALNDARRELAEARSEAERSAADTRRTAAQLESSKTEMGDLRDALAAAEARAAEFEGALRDAQTAAADADSRLRSELSKGAKAALAAQLAEALTEQEQMRGEIESLRSQLEAGAASAFSAAPTPMQMFDEEADTPSPAVPEAPQRKKRLEAAPRGSLPERDARKRQLGEILVREGVITNEDLDDALDAQAQQSHRHIGAILVEKGYAGETDVARALSEQCKVEVVRLSDIAIKPDVPALISPRLAQLHTCIPINVTETTVTLAMDNPLNLIAIEDVERATGRTVETVIATASDIRQAHERFYAQASLQG